MSKKFLLLALVVLLALPLVVPVTATAQDDLPKIGFLPGVVDPFYQVSDPISGRLECDAADSHPGIVHRSRRPAATAIT